MFWRFGGYANVSTLDTILDKPDVTLEELLDESDLIQELKQHNTKLIEYLRDENVLRRLLEYVVAPPLFNPEDEEEEVEEEEPESLKKKTFSPVRSLSLGRSKEDKARTKRQEEREEQEKADKARQKYAYTACEILASETWSIIEALMDNQQHLRQFWEFLRREPALDPTSASYFTKINETLLDKKTEDTLDFVKSLEGIIPAMLQHVDCPMVMDLLLKIISMEKAEGGQGIVDVGLLSFHDSNMSDIDLVAPMSKLNAVTSRLSWQTTSNIHTDVRRRLYKSHYYNLCECISERTIMYRSKQPNKTIGLRDLH